MSINQDYLKQIPGSCFEGRTYQSHDSVLSNFLLRTFFEKIVLKSCMEHYSTKKALHKRKLKNTQNPSTPINTAIFIYLYSGLVHSKI